MMKGRRGEGAGDVTVFLDGRGLVNVLWERIDIRIRNCIEVTIFWRGWGVRV